MNDRESTSTGPLRKCPPVWFQDDYYSPEGHWIECDDDRTHLPPVVDWIGNTPIAHGERDGSPEQPWGPYGTGGPGNDPPCLCGHPDYGMCPNNIAGVGTILDLRIEPR